MCGITAIFQFGNKCCQLILPDLKAVAQRPTKWPSTWASLYSRAAARSSRSPGKKGSCRNDRAFCQYTVGSSRMALVRFGQLVGITYDENDHYRVERRVRVAAIAIRATEVQFIRSVCKSICVKAAIPFTIIGQATEMLIPGRHVDNEPSKDSLTDWRQAGPGYCLVAQLTGMEVFVNSSAVQRFVTRIRIRNRVGRRAQMTKRPVAVSWSGNNTRNMPWLQPPRNQHGMDETDTPTFYFQTKQGCP